MPFFLLQLYLLLFVRFCMYVGIILLGYLFATLWHIFYIKRVSAGENGKSNKVTDCERKVTKLLLLKCPGSADRNIEKMQLQ